MACTRPFEFLPIDTVGRILAHVPLSLLPRTIAAVRASSSGGAVCMAGDAVWQALVPRLDPRDGAPACLSSRKSARLVRGGEASFVRAWGLLLTRAEALHHSVAVCGLDKRHLTLAKLKHLLARFSCALVDHASPVYNATLLMEARGCVWFDGSVQRGEQASPEWCGRCARREARARRTWRCARPTCCVSAAATPMRGQAATGAARRS